MILDLVDYEQKTHKAVKSFGRNRKAAKQKQTKSGKADQGERAGVTGGKNMDGFMALILHIVKANGLAQADIHQNRAVLTLPGYFRPTKLWDLLVIHKGELVVAIELKSQVGPSFGNNSTQPLPSSHRRTALPRLEHSRRCPPCLASRRSSALAGHVAAAAARLG